MQRWLKITKLRLVAVATLHELEEFAEYLNTTKLILAIDAEKIFDWLQPLKHPFGCKSKAVTTLSKDLSQWRIPNKPLDPGFISIFIAQRFAALKNTRSSRVWGSRPIDQPEFCLVPYKQNKQFTCHEIHFSKFDNLLATTVSSFASFATSFWCWWPFPASKSVSVVENVKVAFLTGSHLGSLPLCGAVNF